MTKEDLLTGDIIVNRGGYLGIIIKELDTVYYQTIGFDPLDDFGDDLKYEFDDDEDSDIMQVYRDCSFLDIDNEEDIPIYERDRNWRRPTKEERETCSKTISEENAKLHTGWLEQEKLRLKDMISIVVQQFYGNRTGTEIRREDVNSFLKWIDADKSVARKIVKVPSSDNLVIVYDQNQEDEYVNVVFPEQYAQYGKEYKEHTGREMKMQISCKIPELDFEIHTRCFVCRIDEKGELQSLGNGDGEKFIKYFSV